MIIVKELYEHISLNKSLFLTGISKSSWYYSKTPRNIPLNKSVSNAPKNRKYPPTYGTHQMVISASRELKISVNHKQIRRMFHKLGWIKSLQRQNQTL